MPREALEDVGKREEGDRLRIGVDGGRVALVGPGTEPAVDLIDVRLEVSVGQPDPLRLAVVPEV